MEEGHVCILKTDTLTITDTATTTGTGTATTTNTHRCTPFLELWVDVADGEFGGLGFLGCNHNVLIQRHW